jgi:hypothetical protein
MGIFDEQVGLYVKITGDGVDTLMPRMPEIWNRMQDNGLGAMRSSGFGTFDIIEWTKLESAKVKERAKVEDKRSTAMSNANGAAVQAASCAVRTTRPNASQRPNAAKRNVTQPPATTNSKTWRAAAL